MGIVQYRDKKHTANSLLRNKRLLYLINHPDIISLDVIRERYPLLVAYCLGNSGINQPFPPETTLSDRLIYNMNHKYHYELVVEEFGEGEEEEFNSSENHEDNIKELMQLGRELFLAGKWEGFDYELVDRFQVDHSSKEELQDFEDAYFDVDEEE